MVLKGERFEMRLDEDVLNRVDQWRAKQSDVPTKTEAMRRLVELGLAKSSGESVQFSDGEKLLVVMMRDIYKHLKITNGESDPDFMAEVIFGGHYWAPKWKMQGLYHDHEDDPRDVSLVVDVLDMWSFVEEAYEKFSKKEKERIEKEAEPFGTNVRFLGFDGNNESTHIGITRFFVEKMGRFSRFKKRDFNSHMPTVERYRRMLIVFEPMRRGLIGNGLSASQVISILNARR
jgi:uncharacterized protein YfbU (UPF0304 family)